MPHFLLWDPNIIFNLFRGYYRVVYIGSDAAGNIAFCSFSVVVSQAECQTPKPDEQVRELSCLDMNHGGKIVFSSKARPHLNG